MFRDRLFIDGEWCEPARPATLPVFNPATGEVLHQVRSGGPDARADHSRNTIRRAN